VCISEKLAQSVEEFSENKFFISQCEFLREAIRVYLSKFLQDQRQLLVKLPSDPRRKHAIPMNHISLHLPDEYIDAIEILRKRNKIETRSDFIRSAISEFIEEMEKTRLDLNNFINPRKVQQVPNRVTFNDGSERHIQSISEYMKSRRDSALLQRNA
jgi:Arc/MetJ-type ribon-helix-helix transcriptional regulator